MTTVRELLDLEPESKTTDIHGILVGNYGAQFNFVPEATVDVDELVLNGFCPEAKWGTNTRIETHLYKDFDFDGKRGWRLGAVFFDNEAFMIIQGAGRYLDDYSQKFVLDKDTYDKAIAYIRTILPVKPLVPYNGEVTSLDSECINGKNNLTTFYGDNLDGYFQKYF